MKRLFLFFLILIAFSSSTEAQIKLGAGGTYYNEIGLQARLDIGLNENLGVIPQFSYYFEDLFTVYSFDLNFTYDVAIIAGDVPLYAIGGLDLRTFSTTGASERNLGVNLGGGILMGHVYAEAFYRSMFCDGCSSDLGFNLGYYF